jgi:hypothetical protein
VRLTFLRGVVLVADAAVQEAVEVEVAVVEEVVVVVEEAVVRNDVYEDYEFKAKGTVPRTARCQCFSPRFFFFWKGRRGWERGFFTLLRSRLSWLKSDHRLIQSQS